MSRPVSEATWAPNGSALYYLDGAGISMMRRGVRLGGTVELDEQQRLFSSAGTRSSNQMRMYDIHPDGVRFLFITSGEIPDVPEEEIQGD